MGRILALLFVLLAFGGVAAYPVGCGNGGVKVISVMEAEYDRFCLLERRGLCREFVLPFYTDFYSKLLTFVQSNYPFSPSFSETCLTATLHHTFFDSMYNGKVVDAALAEAIHQDPNLFYLPPEEIPDSKLEMGEVSSLKLKTWQKASFAATGRAVDIKPAYVALLPDSLQFYYEPNPTRVYNSYVKYTGNQPMMKATELMEEVAKIAVELKLLQVNDDDITQLLKHATAFSFTAARYSKWEGDDLEVSAIMLPFYRQAYRTLTAGFTGTKPTVDVAYVKQYMGDDLKVLSTFASGGKVEQPVADLSSGTYVGMRSVPSEALHARKVSAVAAASDVAAEFMPQTSGSSNMESESIEDSTRAATVDRNGSEVLETEGRQWLGCTWPYWYYHMTVVTDMDQHCCASLCEDTVLLSGLSVSMSKPTCCGVCNKFCCSLAGVLSEVATITLAQYGLYPQVLAISVVL